MKHDISINFVNVFGINLNANPEPTKMYKIKHKTLFSVNQYNRIGWLSLYLQYVWTTSLRLCVSRQCSIFSFIARALHLFGTCHISNHICLLELYSVCSIDKRYQGIMTQYLRVYTVDKMEVLLLFFILSIYSKMYTLF